jgi:hypothetical protein
MKREREWVACGLSARGRRDVGHVSVRPRGRLTILEVLRFFDFGE